MYNNLLRKIDKRRQLVLYGLIGVTGIAIDIVVFLLLVNYFEVSPIVATVISTLCGITNNFLLNRSINFKKLDATFSRLVCFFSVGIAGALLSGVLLLVLSEVFSLDPNLVKLVSIPPIVVLQYFLNKQISFGDKAPDLRRVFTFIVQKKLLLLLNLCFFLLCITLAKTIPFIPNSVGGPDELQHQRNVTFLLEKHRLPVSGIDDKDSYSQCRDNEYGKVPCLYSYQVNPQFNYIVSASVAKLGAPLNVSILFGARLASVLWGMIFLNLVYLIARLYLTYKKSLLITASIAFIPQIIFISSYVNQDIHSLAIASAVLYTSVSYLCLGRSYLRWPFYLSVGAIFLAKYNYFIIALIPAILLLRNYLHERNIKKLAIDVGLVGISSIVISSYWYIRNYILYNDVLGQSFVINEMAKYHSLGRELPLTDVHSYLILFQFDFFNALFKSFFANFGYLYIQLDESYYTVLKFLLCFALILLFVITSKKARLILALTISFTAIVVFQVIANALTYDYQAQGRYVFAIIPVVVLAIAYALKEAGSKNPNAQNLILVGGVATTSWLLLQSTLEFAKALTVHAL